MIVTSRAEASTRHGLVRALPSRIPVEARARDRLPGRGSRSQRATRSRLIDPTTAIRRLKRRVRGGRRPSTRAACPRRSEEGRPRATSGPGAASEARRRREPFERAHQYRELEVDGSDAVRAGMNTGAVEHRAPLDELAGPGPCVPRLALRALGLELERGTRDSGRSRPASAVSTRSAARRSAACLPPGVAGIASPLPSARGAGRTRATPPRTRGAARRGAAR